MAKRSTRKGTNSLRQEGGEDKRTHMRYLSGRGNTGGERYIMRRRVREMEKDK